MADVTRPDFTTLAEIPVERVLDEAKKEDFTIVLVLGRKEGGELVPASSTAGTAEVLLMIKEFEHALLSGEYEEAYS